MNNDIKKLIEKKDGIRKHLMFLRGLHSINTKEEIKELEDKKKQIEKIINDYFKKNKKVLDNIK